MRYGGLRIKLLFVCSAVALLPGCGPPKAREGAATAETPPAATAASDHPAHEGRGPAIEVADASSAVAPTLEIPTEPVHRPRVQDATPPPPLPASKAPLPLDRLPVAELAMPKVVLTDHHAAMCPVKVGDAFPNLELPDTAGAQRSLTELYGSKLTLVIFWNSMQPTALEELSDMNRYYLPRFAEKGLTVVAVNVGEPAVQAGELAKAAGATFVVLSDPDRKAFSQVATQKLPRSYLLDASGRVIWFDMEYSPTTRRDLAVAIRHTLGE